MVLPPPSTSRLTALRSARSKQQQHGQSTIAEFLRKSSPLPLQRGASSSASTSTKPARQKSPVLSGTIQHTPSSHKIMDGVVACLDVRTEDGDDVSQNFERALQSMGAKTRRTFSDSITHLIFKNGSPATLKKALSKNVFIINLLWVSRCKKEGKRLAERDFIIERPQGLVLAGKKRRKSMEPGKVRALVMNELMEPSLSSGSDSSMNEDPESSSRRNTIATSTWKARDFKRDISKERTNKRIRPDFDLLEEEEPVKAAEIKLTEPRLSLPISVESIASRHDKIYKSSIIPVNAPSLEKKEQIKARFSIGNNSNSNLDTSNRLSVASNSTSISSSSTATVTTPPIKRKRRLTGNLYKPPSLNDTSTLLNNIIQSKTIVFTSLTKETRKVCMEAIKKLGHYELATEVTEHTTHVIVGAQRRTQSVTLGLLRGVWLLKPEWLITSSQKSKYQSEKEYEALDWYPRANLARNHQPLLSSTTVIQVLSTSLCVEFMQQLIELAGGRVTTRSEEANIIINDKPIKEKLVVTEDWLLQSIEQWQNLSTDKYALKNDIQPT